MRYDARGGRAEDRTPHAVAPGYPPFQHAINTMCRKRPLGLRCTNSSQSGTCIRGTVIGVTRGR